MKNGKVRPKNVSVASSVQLQRDKFANRECSNVFYELMTLVVLP